MKAVWVGALLVAALVAGGCRSGSAPVKDGTGSSAAAVSEVAAVPLDPATLGEVAGTVRFLGKAPAALTIDTSMDPACGLSGGSPVAEQVVAKDGKLANVFVYVKAGPAAAMQARAGAATPVVVDQKGCVYTPHVVAVARGGAVEFRNSDPTMHNIHTMPGPAGNAAIDVSQRPRGAPQTKRFDKPEIMMPVRCNNHPWMNAFINVSETPFFAVTDKAGKYDLRGLPPGDYTLGAVQEKLGEQTMQVTVKAQGTTKADVAFAVR